MCCRRYHQRNQISVHRIGILANYLADKGLLSKMDKGVLPLNSKKINSVILKWVQDLNRHFSQATQMVRWYFLKNATSLATGLYQSKPQLSATSYLYSTEGKTLCIQLTQLESLTSHMVPWASLGITSEQSQM